MTSVAPLVQSYAASKDPAPQSLVNAGNLDAQTIAVIAKINELIAALGIVIRDDNRLTDAIVSMRSLGADVIAQLASKGTWQAKVACRVAAGANVTVSNPGTSSFDGVTLTSGDRVFLTAQTAPAENGIYVFNGSGVAMTRATDADSPSELDFAYALITSGLTYAGAAFLVLNSAIALVGTDAIQVTQILGGVPTIAATGSTTTRTLANRFADLQIASITALKALTPSLLPDKTPAFVQGYYLPGDGGGGWFYWDAANVTADNGGVFIQPQAGGNGRWVRVYSGQLTPEWFGAKGDKTTDDTAAVTAAIAQIGSDGGGEMHCRRAYRVRSQLVLPSGIRISGAGQFYLDPAANVYSFIVTSGAEVSGLALTADLLKGTRVATLASTASFTVGQIVSVRSPNKYGSSYPQAALEIVSKTSTTLTFKQTVTCDYLVADSAVVVGMTMVSDVTLVGISVVCSPTSDINYPLRFNHAQRLRVSGVRLIGQVATTNPTDAAGMVATNYLDVEFDRCTAEATTVAGAGIEGYGGSDCRFIGCEALGYDFGMEISLTSGAIMQGCIVRSPVVKGGNRGLKIKGTWDATITGCDVMGFDTGCKVEECRDYTITGNTFAYVGYDTNSNCINCANQVANAGQMGSGTITGNTLRGLTGDGIFLDAGNSYVTIEDNEIEDVQLAAIYCQAPDCTISHNTIRDWGKAYVGSNDQLYAGINVPVTKGTIIGNRFNNAVLNTVPDVATTISDGTLVLADNYSDTNNILFFSSSNKPPINGYRMGPSNFSVVDPSRPYATAVGGCPQTRVVNDSTSFTFVKTDEGCLFIVTVNTAGSALSALFFCDTATGAVTLVNDPSGNTFSVTPGTSSRVNVSKSGGSNTITVENKLGSAKAIRVSMLGCRLTSVT